jgi:nucleotide-binding universal stress UspA family protein
VTSGAIIALYDGSPFSKRAFPWAVELARRTAAPLHIVRAHVFGVAAEQPLTTLHDERASLVESERNDVKRVAKRLAGPGVVTTPVLLEHGPPIPQLIEYINQQNAAWVVMATHGRGGFSRFWLGSTATSVIRECDVPIFLLPGKGRHTNVSIKQIVAATDGSAISETILDPVAGLAKAFDANLTLVELLSAFEIEEVMHERAVSGPPFDPRATAESLINAKIDKQIKRLADAGLRVASLVRPTTEPIAPSLLHAAAQLGADVLALSTHGRGFWSRAAFGSVADKVMRTATIPLVVYHSRA